MLFKAIFAGLFLLGTSATTSFASRYPVTSAADIAALADKVRPGDELIMANGVWTNQVIVFKGHGTAKKPITLRAQTPGKVVLTSASSVTINGDFLVASGFLLQNGTPTDDGIKINGSHCRLTESSVTGGNYKFFVHIYGTENRMDHCFLAEKTSNQPTLEVEVGSQPNHDLIDHNYFGHRPPQNRNGGETMRVGYSWQSMSNSATVVEQNLFERCDGEIEIISSKSCENIYRFNTFLDCAGMLTLRHGNRCLVEGNFFIAHHKHGSGGIRVIGEDHTIINNYIDGIEQGAFWITSGISNSPLNGYFRARNCLIAFNTVVDADGPCVDQSAGLGTNRRRLLPENITLANNIFQPATNGTLLIGTAIASYHWIGNLAQITTNLPSHAGIQLANLKLQRDRTGLWRPAKTSPARNAAEGDFPMVKTDIDGQKRTSRADAGCDQYSTARITNRPLTPADVGPEWMMRK